MLKALEWVGTSKAGWFVDMKHQTCQDKKLAMHLSLWLQRSCIFPNLLFLFSSSYPFYPQDLTNLNRPLTKVIIVDTDPKSVKFHPENSIILDKWTGDIHDRTLWDLIPFLQSMPAVVYAYPFPVASYPGSLHEKEPWYEATFPV